MWKCKRCQEEIEGDLDVCWNCGTGKDGAPPSNPDDYEWNLQEESADEVLPSRPAQAGQKLTRQRKPSGAKVQALRSRYADAYKVAFSTVEFGHLVQIVGIVLGVLVALFSIFLTSSAKLPGGAAIGGILVGCTIAVLVYGLGTQIAAQGQSLLASLDNAVNSSPFLSEDQKASIMGL